MSELKKCPVCYGRGFVKGNFYDVAGETCSFGDYAKKQQSSTICMRCNGKGILEFNENQKVCSYCGQLLKWENEENFKMTIKEARIEAGLTQQKLADLLGIPKRSIENWEGGKSKPPPYVERLIVEKLQTMKKEQD